MSRGSANASRSMMTHFAGERPPQLTEEDENLEMKPAALLNSNQVIERYDAMTWSNVLDEADSVAIALSVDSDDQDTPADEHSMLSVSQDASDADIDIFDGELEYTNPYTTHREHEKEDDSLSVRMEPSGANAEFGQWEQQFDPQIGLTASALSDLSAQLAIPFGPVTEDAEVKNEAMELPLGNIAHAYGGSVSIVDQNQAPSQQSVGGIYWHRPHVLSFDVQEDGSPFALSKPLVRDDGVLLVGTENFADNRIFVTSFRQSAGTMDLPTARIPVKQEVRDMQWLGSDTAVVALGNEIQILKVGGFSEPSCLTESVPTIHSDAIREMAVHPNSCLVLSGGFDETVVVSDLHDQRNLQATSIVSKYDAFDVVSSVRWAPDASQFSWTTDGGEVQVVDSRKRGTTILKPASIALETAGGLFIHEYLSNVDVVLGYEKGLLAFIDTRMPHNQPYAIMPSSLAGVGEIRRTAESKFAIFGFGGFATAQVAFSSAEDLVLGDFARLQEHQIGINQYKTSGDFSYKNSEFLAVSDNLGTVSLYSSREEKSAKPAVHHDNVW